MRELRKRKSWRAKYYELQTELFAVKELLGATLARLEPYVAQEQFERLREQINWSDFDKCQSEVTNEERALFEASPAYLRYQRLREDRERRGTGDWRLRVGDWRSP